MSLYIKITDGIFRVIEILAMVLLMSVITLFFIQTILRFGLNYALPWAEELCRYLFIWMVFLGAGIGIRSNAHVGFDIIKNMLPARYQKHLTVVIHLIVIGFAVAVISGGGRLVAQTNLQVSSSLGIPMSWVYMALLVGAALFLFFSIDVIIRKVAEK